MPSLPSLDATSQPAVGGPPPADAAPAVTPAALRSSLSSVDIRSEFFFRRRHGQLNWAKLRAVDLERVVRTVDVDVLQDNVEHITFADMTEADLAHLTDANFLQLFRLTQLILEYLLNVQNFLLADAKKKEATHEQLLAELEETRTALAERIESERAARKELKSCRRVIKTYERNLATKYTDLTQHIQSASVGGSTSVVPSKCNVCASVFVNHEFLIGHYKRRHPNEPLPPAPAPAPAATPAAAQQTPDLDAWKREMEATVRSQLLDAQRQSQAKKADTAESEMAQRLAKLEATLAAILNNHAVPMSHDDSPRLGASTSRASGLRDDDGGARVLEDASSVKEYVRRQMFDLSEEIRALRGQRAEQAYNAPYHTVHEPASSLPSAGAASPIAMPEHLSPKTGAHASALLSRFHSSPAPPTRHPHPPSYPHTVTSPIPHGVETIARHIPTATPLRSPLPSAQPRPTHEGALSPTAAPTPGSLLKLRSLLVARSEKTYELFPDLPGLLARFTQSEEELLSHLNSFEVIASTIVDANRMDEVEYEVQVQGCADLLPRTEEEVEEYVRRHYKRPQELLDAFKALALRQERNEALGEEHARTEEQQRRELEELRRQREELEAARAQAEELRRREIERQQLEHDLALRAAKEAEAAANARIQREYQEYMASLASPAGVDVTTHRPPPLQAMSPSASALPTASPSPSPSYPQASPLASPASSASLSPSPYPVSSPLGSPLGSPFNTLPSPTPSPTVAPSTTTQPSPSLASQVQPSPPVAPSSSFSANPNILNPTIAKSALVLSNPAAATAVVTPSGPAAATPASAPSRANLPKRPSIGTLKRPTALRNDADDTDDDTEFERKFAAARPSLMQQTQSMPTTAPASVSGPASTPAVATVAPTVQRPPSLPTSSKPSLAAATPKTVPVPIPARPNKQTINAALTSSQASTPTVSPNAKAAAAAAATANAGRPVPQPTHSPRVEDSSSNGLAVGGSRRATRRLSNRLVEFDQSDEQDLLTRDKQNASQAVSPAEILEHDTQYEHSSAATAQRDLDDGGLEAHEYGGLEHEYEAKDPRETEAVLRGEDDVHVFSPPTTTTPTPRHQAFNQRTTSGQQRNFDDDEEDGSTGVMPIVTEISPPPVKAKTRQMSEPPANTSLPVHRSAQFSVTDSRDWKNANDSDILDDDIEEVLA